MGNAIPIGRLVADLAAADPDRLAVTVGSESMTRAELDVRSNRLARDYRSRGVGPGAFVTIALPNSVEHYVATLAVWKLGAVPQPVSSRLPAAELDAIVDLARPALIVGVPGAGGPSAWAPGAWSTVPPGHEPPEGSTDAPLPVETSPSWKAVTSGGSTGRPKLIVSTQTGAVVPGDLGPPFGLAAAECQLVPGPLYHNAPFSLSWAGLFLGQHLVVLSRFDAEAALDAIARHHVQWVNLVPTMMLRMLRLVEAEPGRWDLSSLDQLWHMAAPCPAWLKQRWIDLLGPSRVMEVYGGAESQALTRISGDEWLSHQGSVGRPFVGQVTVLDREGNTLPAGEVGEVYLRPTPGDPPTYHYRGADPRRRDGGWESIGDMGWLDPDGYLYLTDRTSDLIVTGGENVYPAEVEAALLTHPRVLSAGVVGLPDAELGERVHAVVQVDEHEAPPGEEDLLAHVADQLVRYKLPRSVEVTTTTVRDDAGKVRRSHLRERARAEMDLKPQDRS